MKLNIKSKLQDYFNNIKGDYRLIALAITIVVAIVLFTAYFPRHIQLTGELLPSTGTENILSDKDDTTIIEFTAKKNGRLKSLDLNISSNTESIQVGAVLRDGEGAVLGAVDYDITNEKTQSLEFMYGISVKEGTTYTIELRRISGKGDYILLGTNMDGDALVSGDDPYNLQLAEGYITSIKWEILVLIILLMGGSAAFLFLGRKTTRNFILIMLIFGIIAVFYVPAIKVQDE